MRTGAKLLKNSRINDVGPFLGSQPGFGLAPLAGSFWSTGRLAVFHRGPLDRGAMVLPRSLISKQKRQRDCRRPRRGPAEPVAHADENCRYSERRQHKNRRRELQGVSGKAGTHGGSDQQPECNRAGERANYLAPQPPAAQQQQPPQQPQQGNVIERNYQQSGNDETTLIERRYQDNKLIEETKRYFAPGQMVPAPQPPENNQDKTKSSSWDLQQPKLLQPIPANRTASLNDAWTPVAAVGYRP